MIWLGALHVFVWVRVCEPHRYDYKLKRKFVYTIRDSSSVFEKLQLGSARCWWRGASRVKYESYGCGKNISMQLITAKVIGNLKLQGSCHSFARVLHSPVFASFKVVKMIEFIDKMCQYYTKLLSIGRRWKRLLRLALSSSSSASTSTWMWSGKSETTTNELFPAALNHWNVIIQQTRLQFLNLLLLLPLLPPHISILLINCICESCSYLF